MASGHRFPDVMEYSWSQFLAFLKADGRLRKEQDYEFFSLSLIASRGGSEQVKQVLSDYRE